MAPVELMTTGPRMVALWRVGRSLYDLVTPVALVSVISLIDLGSLSLAQAVVLPPALVLLGFVPLPSFCPGIWESPSAERFMSVADGELFSRCLQHSAPRSRYRSPPIQFFFACPLTTTGSEANITMGFGSWVTL
ncbi:hypothetical protein BDW71DRAFT_178406 [Aspergillus fruticulosus]